MPVMIRRPRQDTGRGSPTFTETIFMSDTICQMTDLRPATPADLEAVLALHHDRYLMTKWIE